MLKEMMLQIAILGLGVVLGSTFSNSLAAQGNTLDSEFSSAVTEFVADLTHNDKAALAKVKSITQKIPKTQEETGFYLPDDVSNEEAVFRAVITWLAQKGFLMTFEDKYVSEMLEVFFQNKVLATGQKQKVLLPFMSEELYDQAETILEIEEDQKKWRKYSLDLRNKFPQYTKAVESLFAREKKVLMCVDIPAGDTLFVLVADKKFADKWRNTVFLGNTNTPDYFGIRDMN